MSDTKIYPDHLRGVGCDVTNCKYHTVAGNCNADKITVESPNAIRKAETFCSTFEARATASM